ncbi:MAG: hypothetical protein HDR01_07965 [Lachnospiraceae bacterium]|nr:hypothetical protein [Lachnospiraceae bacterium]
MEYIEEKDESQKLMEQLEYSIYYKKRDLEFAIASNSSRHRELGRNLDLCNTGLRVSSAIFLFLLIIGRVFLYLIGIGDSFVTSAFGLIYLIGGVFYFGVMLALFIKTADSFMLWFENSGTRWGNHYCEKNEVFTIAMEQAECAERLTKYQNDMERLDEIEKKLEGQIMNSQLREWFSQVEAMKIEPETKKGKTRVAQKEKWKRGVISTILFLLLFAFFF